MPRELLNRPSAWRHARVQRGDRGAGGAIPFSFAFFSDGVLEP